LGFKGFFKKLPIILKGFKEVWENGRGIGPKREGGRKEGLGRKVKPPFFFPFSSKPFFGGTNFFNIFF